MSARSSAAVLKPDLDHREYRHLRLPNRMQVLLIADADADKAAACMDVGVGHSSDPEELPGLAHFCEHMLFLGTKKYPEEGSYQKLLAAHGGGAPRPRRYAAKRARSPRRLLLAASNAYTAYENTNYYFDVTHAHLEPVLDQARAPLVRQRRAGPARLVAARSLLSSFSARCSPSRRRGAS